MIEILKDIIGLLARVPPILDEWFGLFGISGLLVFGFILANLVSWGLTQWLKFHYGWGGKRCAGVAFVLAFFTCFTVSAAGSYWPPPWLELWTAVTAGLLAPSLYKLLTLWGKKRYPWIRKLSIDRNSTGESP